MSSFSTSAYSKNAKRIFELDFEIEGNLSILDLKNKIFLNDEKITMYSPAVNGLFVVEKRQNGATVSFDGTTMKYFNIIVAVYWKLYFSLFMDSERIFASEFEELHCLGLNTMPKQFTMNTSFLVCLKSTAFNVNVKFLGNDVGTIRWSPD